MNKDGILNAIAEYGQKMYHKGLNQGKADKSTNDAQIERYQDRSGAWRILSETDMADIAAMLGK